MQPSDPRLPLMKDLGLYPKLWFFQKKPWVESEEILPAFLDFITNHPDCFHRENQDGHITGSGYVVNSSFNQILLTHHRKLNDWLQLGGHSDGDPHSFEVALKECQEESGLKNFEFVDFWTSRGQSTRHPLIFDLDRHLIPARKSEPEHYHYDVRYLLQTDEKAPLQITEESNDLKWIPLSDAYEVARQSSMHRPFKKIEFLRDTLLSQNSSVRH